MKFSVIIPVRNRPAEIARCVDSVRASAAKAMKLLGNDCEILVVDNGSTDATARVAAEAGARVVSEPLPNRCRARNRGGAEARGEWIVFIDSDCVADAEWLGALERETDLIGSEERVAAVAGAVLAAEPTTNVEAFIAERKWIDQEKFLTPGRRFSPPFAATANLAIRRDVFLTVGDFDLELASAGEDADWCWRAAKAGWTLRYAPGAAVTHYHRATLGGLWRQALHYGIGNAELFAKWRGEWGMKSWIEPEHYVWAAKGFLKAPFALVFGKTPLARREAFYDGVANLAMALGRVYGGARRGVLVI